MEFLKRHAGPLFGFLFGLALIGMTFFYLSLDSLRTTTSARQAALEEKLAGAVVVMNNRDARILELESLLGETKTMLEETINDLDEEKDRNKDFEDQIEKIGSAVGTLDKLAKTDPELLQKYSKVFFLNEHYMPPKVVEIDKDFMYHEAGEPEFIHRQVEPFLEKMLKKADDDGVKIWVLSAFRSFDEQRALKGAYTVNYGTGANAFSADQGYSEHQLGTTIDFTTENLNGALTGFGATPAYAWLQKNAYKYGFTLSYPEGNAYYVYEPWHWRFVGTELARDLYDDKKYFYDLDQRELDKYLISIFD